MSIPEKLLKPYNPNETEDRIYKLWEESGFFNPDTCIEKGVTDKNAKPFTIMMPPPNVTGVLHMGHALGLSIQDTMIRFERMRGKRTLWLPGTDHAAIATQSKVEKDILKNEEKTRHDLGREEFLKRVENFAKESHDTIVRQIRVMGASCDWSREAFTLDENRNLAVRTMFKKMYDDGLIYRGYRVINWDPKGQTTIADDEIVHEERKAKLYTFKYSEDFPISISTTRPETKVGDTGVAVHPDDPRYKKFIGKEYDAVFCGVPIHIKIIADEAVEKDFGTGALGVTPAHSMTDADIAKRHGLKIMPVINEYAKMTVGDERILGKKTTIAREAIIEWLKSEGLLEGEEDVTQNVGTAERTGGIVEPLPKLQWFIDVNKPFTIPHSEIKGIAPGAKVSLKDIMRAAVEYGQVKIIPEHFDKTYFHWVDNLRDWCISRQIWYGHRIPVWYPSSKLGTSKDDEIYVGIKAPEGSDWVQDEDTLDTWFSSGLWSFSTLGWPKLTDDLKTYHPTNVIVPAYEILFFWIARMILMTGYALGTVPFHNVYLTGIIRDKQGQKFSKSLGNGIDPIDIAKKYGADAGRMALIVGNTPGTDMKMAEDKIKGYKNFSNKIWNITRFVLENTENEKPFDSAQGRPKITEADQTLLDELETLIVDTTKDMENFRLYMASEKIYHYLWHRFADIILEDSKKIFQSGSEEEKNSRKWTLIEILKTSLKLLHPFMPYVTEELWSILSGKNLLIVEKWPSSAKASAVEALK